MQRSLQTSYRHYVLVACLRSLYHSFFFILQNPNVHHPKTIPLALTTEKIINISATAIRCSVSTETGKVATWLDELLGHVASRLEHPAQAFTEFTLDKIVSLHTCALYTVARLESGTLYWW